MAFMGVVNMRLDMGAVIDYYRSDQFSAHIAFDRREVLYSRRGRSIAAP